MLHPVEGEALLAQRVEALLGIVEPLRRSTVGQPGAQHLLILGLQGGEVKL